MAYTVIGGIGVMTLGEGVTMPNPANVMTLNNQVMLCGDAELSEYRAGSVIATLSEDSLCPGEDVVIPVCVTSDGETRIAALTVNPLGEISLPFDYANGATVHLNGIQFTANSQYYTPEIGNIYNNGTSPLSET